MNTQKRHSEKTKAFLHTTLTLLTALLASCSGSNDVANTGGIGGSGKTGGTGGGEITAFGSVIFDDKQFAVNSGTTLTLDGEEVSSQDDLGVGMIATFELGDDAASDLLTGTALRIDAMTAVKGAVTQTTPLTVLGQQLFVTGDTVLEDIPGNDIANLLTTDTVEVYGVVDSNNVIRASRIEYKTTSGLTEWKLTGYASSVVADALSIGSQAVNISGITADNCVGGLSIGDFVEIKAEPNTGFTGSDTLELVSKVECVNRAIPAPNNPSSSNIPASFEGIVSDYTGAGDLSLSVGAQTVTISSVTEYKQGTLADLVNGVRVEAKGTFNTNTLVLSASEIKFKQARVRIEAPLESSEVTLGMSIELMGQIIVGTSLTEDDDSILSAASGLPAQVEARGFVDSDGVIYAEEIRERGDEDATDVRLRGPIDSLSTSLVEIVGISANLSGAATYFDASGTSITQTSFLDLIVVGDIIEIEDATLNPDNSVSMDSNTIVSLEH